MERFLELHFDINKTVLVDDKVQGIDAGRACNQILYWLAWGRVDDGRWSWSGDEPRLSAPGPGRVLFGDVVHQDSELEQRKDELRDHFTEAGFPGAALRPYYERMHAALRLTPEEHAHLAGHQWPAEAGFDGTNRRLLSSFLRLLQRLAEQGPPFSIVFRTFGSDIPEVVAELNALCRGEHPLAPGERFDGADGRPDLRIDLSEPSRFGALHRGGRAGAEPDVVSVAYGVLDSPASRDEPPYDNPLSFYAERSPRALASFDDLQQRLREGGAFAFRDDYAAWARAGFSERAGKPMRRATDGRVRRIFFDDNIREDAAHIIDLREDRAGPSVRFEDSIGDALVRVNPYRAVVDADYFVDTLRGCGVSL